MIVVGLAVPWRWRLAVVGGSVLASVAVIVTQWETPGGVQAGPVALSAEETAESAKLRPILAAVAWRMFCDRPLWGCGFGQYPEGAVDYLADRTIDLPLEKARPFVQHNVLLALLTETGLAGMGLFAIVLGLWLQDGMAALAIAGRAPLGPATRVCCSLPLAGNYLVNGMFQDVAKIPMIHMWLFFAAGLRGAAKRRAEPGALNRLARPLAAGFSGRRPAGRKRPG